MFQGVLKTNVQFFGHLFSNGIKIDWTIARNVYNNGMEQTQNVKIRDRFSYQDYDLQNIIELADLLREKPRKAIIKAVRRYLAELKQQKMC